MKNNLAFVLGGGGSRGALQVGALRALLEAGLQPSLLVGTSIGAINTTYLALHGVKLEGLDQLVAAWHDAVEAQLMPANYLWLTVRALFNRPVEYPMHRMREFFISHGLDPELRYGDIQGVQLISVAADLNSGCPILYGSDPQDRVLEGLLASTALPPWVLPLKMQDRLLIDGGVVSSVPIEPAMRMGATEMIALDLRDFRDVQVDAHGFGPFLAKLFNTVEMRQLELELALAEARGTRVHYLHLLGEGHVPLWHFDHTDDLIQSGYQQTHQALKDGLVSTILKKPTWVDRIKQALRLKTRPVHITLRD